MNGQKKIVFMGLWLLAVGLLAEPPKRYYHYVYNGNEGGVRENELSCYVAIQPGFTLNPAQNIKINGHTYSLQSDNVAEYDLGIRFQGHWDRVPWCPGAAFR
ncbi:MAG: hypothetical protein M1549_03020 [Candidatus Dependentiae bacterium]|nr:hypothetical protein [Candidatus Dependentiae bacterium]